MKNHSLHIVIKTGEHYMLNRPGQIHNEDVASIPGRHAYEARWIYNFTTGKILKNSAGVRVMPVHDAVDIDNNWLRTHGYIVTI